MSREPEAIVTERRQLGAALATFRPNEAVEKFQQLLEMTSHQVRGRYLHLGCLLSAQVKVEA